MLSALNSALGAGSTRSGAVARFLSALLLLGAGAVQEQTDSTLPCSSRWILPATPVRRLDAGARATAETAASEAEFS